MSLHTDVARAVVEAVPELAGREDEIVKLSQSCTAMPRDKALGRIVAGCVAMAQGKLIATRPLAPVWKWADFSIEIDLDAKPAPICTHCNMATASRGSLCRFCAEGV